MSVRRTWAALAAAALLLASCSDDPEPRFEPTESPSPSESETTVRPEAQTPEEFIREWFELAVAMQNTGDSEGFLAVSDDCGACRDLSKSVNRIYLAGGSVSVRSMEVTSVRDLPGREFSVMVDASETKLRERAGAELQTLPANSNEYRMFLRPVGDSWVMTDYLDTPS